MKKFYLFAFIIILFSILSCEIKEEITINKDGSGEVYYNYDLSKLVKEFKLDTQVKKDGEKPVDTIIDFNQLLNNPKFKDRISSLTPEKKEMLKSLKNMKMKMVMDEANKKMSFGFGFSFKNIDSLKNMFEKIQKAQQFSSNKKQTNMVQDKPIYQGLSGANQDLSYKYNGKIFQRTVKLKKLRTEEEQKEIDKDVKQNDKTDALFNKLKYTIVLHFPKKIKKVNAKIAVFSKDKKTVTISYGLDTYLKNPENLNLKVKLAKK